MQKKNVKKAKEKNRKKIFILILMILFTGVVLTSSTYAWFTTNKAVTVQQMDVNVTTSEGLQVSVDAKNWKTVISVDDINGAGTTYTGAVNQVPTDVIFPVSSIGEVDSSNGFMKMFKGSVSSNDDGEFVLSADQEVETHGKPDGSFIAFDLFFQTNAPATLYLTSDSNVVAKNASKGIENAARVAFIDEGNVPAGTSADEAQALKEGNTPVMWEPNYDVHTSSAVKHALDVYGITTTTTGGVQLAYNGVKAVIPSSAGDDGKGLSWTSDDSTYFSAVTPKIKSLASGIPTSAYEQVFSIEAGITKVRIYMWVEGQDVDCEDNASGSSLSYNLQFSTLANA